VNIRLAASLLTASVLALGSIAGFEGYRERTYDDGVGVNTIGFGATEGVKPGDKIDPVRAVQRLAADTDAHAKGIARCIGDVPLHQHEFDAYVILAYNIGVGAFCKSTLVKKLKQVPPDYAGACAEILRWNKAGGRELRGLTKRRQAEHAMCMGTQ